MKVCPVLVQGTLSSSLKYDFGHIEKITQGSWQMSLATIAFHLMKRPKDPKKSNKKFKNLLMSFVT